MSTKTNQISTAIGVATKDNNGLTCPVDILMNVLPQSSIQIGPTVQNNIAQLSLNLNSAVGPRRFDVLRSISYAFWNGDATEAVTLVIYIPASGQYIYISVPGSAFQAGVSGSINIVPVNSSPIFIFQTPDSAAQCNVQGSVNFNNFEIEPFISGASIA